MSFGEGLLLAESGHQGDGLWRRIGNRSLSPILRNTPISEKNGVSDGN
jgi:hypothetical protein